MPKPHDFPLLNKEMAVTCRPLKYIKKHGSGLRKWAVGKVSPQLLERYDRSNVGFKQKR